MIQKISCISVLCCILFVGCSSHPDEKVETYLSSGKYEKAVTWLSDVLKNDPSNTYLNYLLSYVYIQRCVAEKCFDKNPELLRPLQTTVPHIKTLNATYKDQSKNIYNAFNGLLMSLRAGEDHPVSLVTLLKAMPKSLLQTQMINFMAKEGLDHIKLQHIPEAISLYSAIAFKLPEDDPNRFLSMIIYGYASNDESVIAQSQASVGRIDESLNASSVYVQALPYALYRYAVEKNPNGGTQNFIQNFRSHIQKMNFAYFATPEGRAELGNSVYAISRDKPFILNAQKHFKIEKEQEEIASILTFSGASSATASVSKTSLGAMEDVTLTPVKKIPDIPVTENVLGKTKIPDADVEERSPLNEELRLRFMKLALLVNPSSEKSWKLFLEQATSYAMETGRASVIFDHLRPQDVPATIISWYNGSLFKLMHHNIKKNKSILGLVQHVTLPSTGADAVKTQVSSLLNEAMIKAVDDENYDLVYEYASFQPDVAKLSRQKIVSITIDALEKKWNLSEFEGMDILAQFLTRTMGIDFSLDSFLLQSFDDQILKSGIQEKLGADNPDNLLKDRESVRVDLLDKFEYLRTHFKKQPEVLDNLLKSLIVKAEGSYGVPNALYLLYDYFSDAFTEKERAAYLVGAVKKSLSEDEKMTPQDFAQKATDLQEKFPEISMLFVVNKTLERTKGLADIKSLWENAPEPFVRAMKEIKPQYVTLMTALAAYDKGNHQKAASLFTILSDPKLIKIARPYLTEYVATVKEHAGVYVTYSSEKDSKMNTQMIRIELSHEDETVHKGQKSVSDTSETDFLGAYITFISSLGSLKEDSVTDFSEDYGKVVVFKGKGQINPNTMSVIIPESIKSAENLPVSFEKIFGDIAVLHLMGDALLLETPKENYTFEKVSSSPKVIFPPQGRYSLLEPLSDDKGAHTYMLPVGSILELYTEMDNSVAVKKGKPYLYQVSGLLYHPAAEDPVTVKGVYNSEESVTSLSYNYPFPGGGTLAAEARCQLVSTYILCAGHNKHWKRKRYTYQISGSQIQPEDSDSEVGMVLDDQLENKTEIYQDTGVRNR